MIALLEKMLEAHLPLLEELGSKARDDAFPWERGDHDFGVREGANEVLAQTVEFGVSATLVNVMYLLGRRALMPRSRRPFSYTQVATL